MNKPEHSNINDEKYKNTRAYVLESLIKINKNSGYGNRMMDSILENEDISDMSSGFFTRLFYGCIEHNIYLDYILRQNINCSVNKLNPYIHYILVMALYQLLFMDKPEHSVVDESVKLAKKYQKRYSGFVNGVLRGFIRKNKKFTLPNRQKERQKYLSVKYSHPQWMVDMWFKEYGADFTEDLLRANQKKATIFVRINTLKLSKNSIDMLRFYHNQYQPMHSITVDGYDKLLLTATPFDDVLELRSGATANFLKTDAFQKNYFYIQDLATAAVSYVANPHKGDKIIDMCAAPGGKSIHMATLVNNDAEIIAWDIHEHRVHLIKENAKRYGASCVIANRKDSTKFDKKYENYADIVLVDVPCSGLGTIRRHGDIKNNRNIEDIKEISKIQAKLLEVAARYVKDGGSLVYSTCTLSNEENYYQIKNFLQHHTNFTLVKQKDMNLPNSWYNTNIHSFRHKMSKNEIGIENIGMELYPNIHGTDGFYICKMIKQWS